MFKTKQQLRRTLDRWAQQTFQENYAKWLSQNTCSELIKMVDYVLDSQRIRHTKMTGYISQNRILFEQECLRLKYGFIANRLNKQCDWWTPFDVIVYCCQHILENRKYYEEKAAKAKLTLYDFATRMCGRALRALPSSIREFQKEAHLKATLKEGTVVKNESLDEKEHCDIRVYLHNYVVTIWSYVARLDSIHSFCEKFTGYKGGRIAEGYHILCAFDSNKDKENFFGWFLHTDDYLNKLTYDIEHLTDCQTYNYDEFVSLLRKNTNICSEYNIVKNNVARNFDVNPEYLNN